MRIQQIRNATLKIRYADQTILLDPWLQDQGMGFSASAVRSEMRGVRSPLNALPITPDEILDGVDFCLVTHIHPDHFTPDYLPKGMRIIVQNEEDRREANSMGFENVLAFEEDTVNFDSVTITKVPAIHGDNERLVRGMGIGSGYILSGERKTLYIAGDTVHCSTVEETLKKHKPDVITVNCCEATMPEGRLIMNLSDVEAVCKQAPKALVIATHLDSVNHALLSSDDVRFFVQTHGLSQVYVPQNGEIVDDEYL